jgi:hypothetical protein
MNTQVIKSYLNIALSRGDCMQIINDNDIRLKFLLGLPVHIDGIGAFHSPSLSEVVDLTEGLYNMSLSAIMFDKKQLTEQDGLEEYSNFQILLSIIDQDSLFREYFFYGLNLHLSTTPHILENGLIYFDELSEDSILTEEKFEYIKKLVKIANNVQEQKSQDEEYKAGNERARKFLEKLKKQREEINKVKKQKINLHSIISAVGWKAQSFDFLNNLNIYQLYDGYYRLGYIDAYENTMTGIYTGNIDGSKIKLADINWANIIEL